MIHKLLHRIRHILALSPQKLTVLLFIIVMSIGLMVQIFTYIMERNPSASEDCIQRKVAITHALEKAAYCTEDSECVAASSLPCPYGCSTYISNKADLADITRQITAYNNQCGFCVEHCEQRMRAKCIKNRCQSLIPEDTEDE